jgi:hypothetical protein
MLDESRASIRNALIHREKIFFARAASAKICAHRRRANARMRVPASAARDVLRCRKMSVRCRRRTLNVRHRTQNKPPSTRRQRPRARLNARIRRRIKTPAREKNGCEKIASASSRRAIFWADAGVLTAHAAIIARAKSCVDRRLKKIFARARASDVKALGFFHKIEHGRDSMRAKKSRGQKIVVRFRGAQNAASPTQGHVSTLRCRHFPGRRRRTGHVTKPVCALIRSHHAQCLDRPVGTQAGRQGVSAGEPPSQKTWPSNEQLVKT